MESELKTKWLRLEKLREYYMDTLSAASHAQQQFQPSQGSWNMLQVVQHLILSEKLSIKYLVAKNYTNTRKKGGLATIIRSLGLRFLLRSPVRFKAPPIAAIKDFKIQEHKELLLEWESVRHDMYHYLEKFPGEKMNFLIFRHPRAGWLNIKQTISFFEDHLLHHQRQLKRIREVVNFPG